MTNLFAGATDTSTGAFSSFDQAATAAAAAAATAGAGAGASSAAAALAAAALAAAASSGGYLLRNEQPGHRHP